MDIYILRDGKETGPFTEEATQSMLKQGAILINDLAWRPGMPNWLPLHAVLYPAAQPSAVRPPPPPADATPPPMPLAPGLASVAAAAAPAKPPMALRKPAPAPAPATPEAEAPGEPATARQKAFLSYMGIAFASSLSREQAALLVNGAMENPKDTGRLQRWNEDRLRLHPDLFADEIKARKENRANYFYELCQAEGAEFFEKVTKAHTQVLVGYLDVRFPNWDLREEDAKYRYFFPAIAEKFPQLLKKGAKGRFKYPEGPKVSPELARRSGGNPRSTGTAPSPLAAMLKGVVFGALILGGALAAWSYRNGKWPGPAPASPADTEMPGMGFTETKPPPPPTVPKTAPAPPDATEELPRTAPAAATSIPPIPPAEPTPAFARPAEPKVAATEPKRNGNMAPATGTAPAPANPLEKMDIFGTSDAAPANPPASKGVATVSNPFDPLSPTSSVPLPPKEPAGPPPRNTVKLTKATTITLKFGSSTQRAGTVLPLVGQEGTMVKVKIGAEVVAIPAANTDIAEGDATLAPPAP